MRKAIAVAAGSALLLALLLVVAVWAQEPGKCGPATQVSLVNLIANPEKYDGKRVSVKGFLALEFEGNALYLHKEDFDNRLYKNGLWYAGETLESKKYDRKYVNIEGTFSAAERGHMGLWSGTLKDVDRLWE
jgi:hypothetical protein